jgi:hypothetical protein
MCPDCEKLYAELEALKAELDRVIADLDREHQTLVALVDRHMHDGLARLDRLEAALRFPRREPPEQSEPPARH